MIFFKEKIFNAKKITKYNGLSEWVTSTFLHGGHVAEKKNP